MVSTSLMVDTIPVPSRRNILCAVNCALTLEVWRQQFRDITGDENTSRTRQQFLDAKNSLISKGVVKVLKGYAWIVTPENEEKEAA